MLEDLWTEVCNIVQEVVNKTIRKKKKNKKAKWLSEEALQIAEERRETKSKGERGKVHSTTAVTIHSVFGAQENKVCHCFPKHSLGLFNIATAPTGLWQRCSGPQLVILTAPRKFPGPGRLVKSHQAQWRAQAQGDSIS